jgi:hypothetical protein
MIDVTVGVFVPYLLSEGIRIFPTFFFPRQTFSDTFFPLPGACGARSELVADQPPDALSTAGPTYFTC